MGFNLFEMAGIQMPVEEKKVAEKKTPEKKVTEKKAPETTTKKKMDSVDLPVTVITGYGKNFTLSDTAFPDKKPEDVVLEDVRQAVEKMIPGLNNRLVRAARKDQRTVYITVNPTFVQKKGTLALKEEAKCFLYDKEIPLVDIKESAECDVDVNAIKEYVKEMYSGYDFDVAYSSIGQVISLLPGSVEAEKKILLPVTVKVFGREDLVFTVDDFKVKKAAAAVSEETEEAEENEDEEETTDESEETETSKETSAGPTALPVASVDKKVLEKKILEKYPEFKDCLQLFKGVQKENKAGSCVIARFVPLNAVSTAAPAKKETMYPTEGSTLSLLWKRFELTPEQFEGKKEVSSKEITKFLRKNGYPEYEDSRTFIVYDDKAKIIIPNIKGSGKGASHFHSFEEAEKAAYKEDYLLCTFEQGEQNYRMEKTMVSLTAANADGEGMFRWYLRKLSGNTFAVIREFFRKVALRHNTEALVWIFYEPTKDEYEIYVPEQTVSHAAVKENEYCIDTLERFRVMDIHSHGTIPAFFSSVDDADETGNRLFGVFGHYNENRSVFKLRAGTGDYHCPVLKELVFEDEESDESLVNEYAEALYYEWLGKAML